MVDGLELGDHEQWSEWSEEEEWSGDEQEKWDINHERKPHKIFRCVVIDNKSLINKKPTKSS